jgi:hypothetical protein
MTVVMVSKTAGCWTKLVTKWTRVATCSEVFGFIVLKSPLLGLGCEVTRMTNPNSCFKFARVALNDILDT